MMNFCRSIIPAILLAGMFLTLLPERATAGDLIVNVPSASKTDGRANYFLAVLRLALEKSEVPFSLVSIDAGRNMTHSRKKVSVTRGILSVVWDGAKSTWDEGLQPVKIPIYGGINSLRIFLAHGEIRKKLEAAETIDDLRQFSVGFGIGWAGEEIFKHNGFTTVSAQYDKLFKMLNAGRFDLFSRGVQEAYIEIDEHGNENPNIFVDDKVGLYQSSFIYFYVNESDHRLYKALETGLRKAYADGSFKKLFLTTPEINSALTRAKINDRTWFKLTNPLLTEEEIETNLELVDTLIPLAIRSR